MNQKEQEQEHAFRLRIEHPEMFADDNGAPCRGEPYLRLTNNRKGRDPVVMELNRLDALFLARTIIDHIR